MDRSDPHSDYWDWPVCGLLLSLLAVPVAAPAARGEPPAAGDEPGAALPPAVLLVQPDDWPCWRGPGGGGVRAEPLPGPHWSATHGVLWKVPVPGQGHASPITVGDRVLVSTADERARALLCYHRTTGALLWEVTLHAGAFMVKHEKNSHASPTPACDGRLVYVPYVAGNALWLAAVDLDGRIAWQPRIGPFVPEHGYASSPVLYKNLVIVAADQRGAPAAEAAEDSSYLVGVDRQTGAVVWRVSRPAVASYGSPVVARLAGRDQLLLGGAGRINAYDPATGKDLWFCRWSASRAAGSVAWGGDCVYASVTWRVPEVVCVRADGSGDVTASHLVWRQRRGAADVPSPLYHEGRLYVVNERGMATCLDAGTGQVIWQQRLGAPFTASPVLAGDCILATDEEGTTHVFRAAARFQSVATNPLNETVLASPALSGDRLFLRSRQSLWCLRGQTTPAPRADPGGWVAKTKPERAAAASPLRPAKEESKGSSTGWLVTAGLVGVALALTGAGLLVGSRRRAGERTPRTPVRDKQAGVEAAVPSVSFVCQGCGKKLKARVALAGKRVQCPQCGKPVLVAAPPSAGGARATEMIPARHRPGQNSAAGAGDGGQPT